ncbi:hypothetical protein Poly59_08660 [Rubripirellula reticaptiva]|uniref:Uncharacterized protein n=2 Tax=Rubripirellula reticaptiva TaxID=2528013 RepID=A0A5C6FBM1_9BACT|nr:hypothetical protein Poly59_08660 [Rubripirellula reticaptiva]
MLTIIVALGRVKWGYAVGVDAAACLFAAIVSESIERVVLGHAWGTYQHMTGTRRASLTAVLSAATFAAIHHESGHSLGRRINYSRSNCD